MPKQDFYTAIVVIILFLIGIGLAVLKTWQEQRRHTERFLKVIALRRRNGWKKAA
jgi:predicted transporter